MCKKIIVGEKIISPGDTAVVIIEGLKTPKVFGVTHAGVWSFNARLETWTQKWTTCDWNLCKIPVDGFIEGSNIFFGTFLLSGIHNKQNFLILTQENFEEGSLSYKRTPVFLNQDYKKFLTK